jgi:ATP-binding cassette subfamily F protein 3
LLLNPEKKQPVVEKKKTAAKPQNRKPIESRIKRLEEQIARLSAKKNEIEARLADPAIYKDAAFNTAVADRAYVAKELEQLEAEWLEKQAELER